jgi:hypothetical protein
VSAGLIAARQIASTPIATVILEPVAVYMTGLRLFVERTDVSLITGLEVG